MNGSRTHMNKLNLLRVSRKRQANHTCSGVWPAS